MLIVDDHSIFRSGLRAELDPDLIVLGEAATVDAAITGVIELQPRVVLLDVHLPGGRGGGGAEVIREAAPRAPHTVFLALSVSDAAGDATSQTPRASATQKRSHVTVRPALLHGARARNAGPVYKLGPGP